MEGVVQAIEAAGVSLEQRVETWTQSSSPENPQDMCQSKAPSSDEIAERNLRKALLMSVRHPSFSGGDQKQEFRLVADAQRGTKRCLVYEHLPRNLRLKLEIRVRPKGENESNSEEDTPIAQSNCTSVPKTASEQPVLTRSPSISSVLSSCSSVLCTPVKPSAAVLARAHHIRKESFRSTANTTAPVPRSESFEQKVVIQDKETQNENKLQKRQAQFDAYQKSRSMFMGCLPLSTKIFQSVLFRSIQKSEKVSSSEVSEVSRMPFLGVYSPHSMYVKFYCEDGPKVGSSKLPKEEPQNLYSNELSMYSGPLSHLQGVFVPRCVYGELEPMGPMCIATLGAGQPLTPSLIRENPSTKTQALHAVRALHEAGVLHRNIALHHFVYCKEKDRVLVLDFSFARKLGNQVDASIAFQTELESVSKLFSNLCPSS